MDESRYHQLVDEVFKRIQSALEPVDPDDVEAYASGDVLTLTFRDGSRCVVNTQRSTRQIWLAARSRAWHFTWDEGSTRWMDDRGRGEELLHTVATIVRETTGLEIQPCVRHGVCARR